MTISKIQFILINLEGFTHASTLQVNLGRFLYKYTWDTKNLLQLYWNINTND